MQSGMIERRINIRLASSVCCEIHSQVAVHQGWMTRNIFNIVASDGVDSVDAICRFMQTVALAAVAWQWSGGDPVQVFELDGGCCLKG